MIQDERRPLEAGHRLDDRFEIETCVAQGGFGLTYRARDLQHGGELVALKELFPDGMDAVRGPDGIAIVPAFHQYDVNAILSEAVAQERAKQHAAVARVIKVFTANGTGYIAMEWVDGLTLWDGLPDKLPRDERYVRKLYLTLLDAVLYLGKQKLSHRDLTPRNIMIRRGNGEPVIVDFGASRATGAGNTLLSKTAIVTPGFASPEQFSRHGYQGVWTDVFGVAASLYFFMSGQLPVLKGAGRNYFALRAPLVECKARGHGNLQDYSDELLTAVDRGLGTIEERHRLAGEVLGVLGLSRDDVRELLHPEVFARTSLFDPPSPLRHEVDARYHAVVREDDTRPQPYQRTLLQSFDSARFQATSVKRDDSTELRVDPAVKIALARTEALLSVVFGREIVVPAGHVAESPAFQAVFTEIARPYAARADRIARACNKEGVEPWRPFRLALERAEDRDYLGFIRSYKYTGAPLVLLQAAGKSGRDEQAKGHALQVLAGLFADSKYDALERVLGVPGYGEFARLARDYFQEDKSIFATTDAGHIDATDYAAVFRSRLNDERITGTGVAEARDSLGIVKEIERLLEQSHALGLRGNWYVFAERFQNVWPLARAYLDMRLFMSLAHQYRVDHPVLVSQELEYGRFDHSLYLGPKVAAELEVDPGADEPRQLAAQFTQPIEWEVVLDLYTDPLFLGGIRRMNAAYRGSSERDYRDAIVGHALVLDRLLGQLLSIDVARAELSVSPRSLPSRTPTVGAHDPSMADPAEQARAVQDAPRVLGAYGGVQQHDHVGLRTLCTDEHGAPTLGGKLASAVLHYFVKPYRMLAAHTGLG